MRFALFALALAMSVSVPAWAQDLTVSVPPGETVLGDIGMYRVAYQSYGGEVVEMPVSWTGHFTTESGISYVPNLPRIGREVIFLHSPWKVPPGKAWVDYRLRLPETTPLTLSFGIAMKEDAVIPGRSDGVTFSCTVVEGEQERELMREHHATAEWKDFDFDLTSYAGKTITLRLQVEPGPKNNPGWDYSYFGDAGIVCGSEAEGKADLVAKVTSTKAYRAVADVDLRALSNAPGNGIIPSNALPFQNTVEKTDEGYDFVYKGEDCRVVYRYQPRTGTLDDFTLQVDNSVPFQPALGGGITTVTGRQGEERHERARGGEVVEAALDVENHSLRVVRRYPGQDDAVQVTWDFRIIGKALVVEARSDQARISEFSLGAEGNVPFRKTFSIPYLDGQVKYLPEQNAFSFRCIDWTVSHASRSPQGMATYETKTDGSRNALVEKGYIAVSPNVHEVLPNIPHPPSPYIDQLTPLIMLDVWGHHKGTYQGDAENLRALKDNGVDHLAIIQHVWQRYGYDVKLPDHLPANPQFGGDEGIIEFGQVANEYGYVWSLHENYIDIYPDAPSYDESAVVLRADGSKSPAWFNKGTGVQSYGLKSNRALGFAEQNAPEAHKRFKTTAAYLDVHTCVPPWHQLDHDATQPMAAMALLKVQEDAELFQYMRDTHEGPLFGEGNRHMYWAGLCDGVETQVDGGEQHAPFLDFDLLKIHPQMVNHGMGYYERWFTGGYGMQWGNDSGTPEQVDKYRAMEVAYGHAGFIGNAQTNNVHWVAKEHHMMHPVQRLYGASKAVEVAYEVDGQFVSASAALVVGERGRQRIRYDSGLTVWVNWEEQPWEVEGRVLPQWGFLALGPDTEVCTVLRDGRFADYVECPEYLFVDARTAFDMPYLHAETDIEPTVGAFEYLGDGRIRIAYHWIVNGTLDKDYASFVHFTNEAGEGPEGIVFQNDHDLAAPPSQWKPGDVVVDGPHELTVPAGQFDTYDIGIGLHRGGRVELKGPQNSGNRILIGRLVLEREGGAINNIRLGDISDVKAEDDARRADFGAHLNPPGTWVDFGKVATSGSVKVNRSPEGLTIFPYPRGTPFKVALDLTAIVPGVAIDPAEVQVTALACGTQDDLGTVPHAVADGRLMFETGGAETGRYRVTW